MKKVKRLFIILSSFALLIPLGIGVYHCYKYRGKHVWVEHVIYDMKNTKSLLDFEEYVLVGKVEKRRGINELNYTYHIKNLLNIKGDVEEEIKVRYDMTYLKNEDAINPFEIDNEDNEKVFMLFINKKKNNKYVIDHSKEILVLDDYDLSKGALEQEGITKYTIEHYLNVSQGKVYETKLDVPSEYDFVGIFNSHMNLWSYESQLGIGPSLIKTEKEIPLIMVDPNEKKYQYTFKGENPGDVMFYNVNLNKNEENGVNLFDYCEDINVNKPNVNNYLIFGYYLDRFDIDYNSDENKNTIVLLSNDDIIALPDYPIEAPFEEQSEEYKNSVIELVNNKLGA